MAAAYPSRPEERPPAIFPVHSPTSMSSWFSVRIRRSICACTTRPYTSSAPATIRSILPAVRRWSDCTKTGKITGNTAFGLGGGISASYPMLLAGSTQDYSAYFTPDDPDAFVLFSGSALTLCAKPSATLEGDTLTVSTSSNYKPDAFVLFVAEYDADGRLLAVHSENITPESGIYTFKVQLGAKIKCFLLRTDTYAPLFGTFSPNA